MLFLQQLMHQVIGKIGTGMMLGIRICMLANAASPHEHLRLKQLLGLAGFALDVVDGGVVFYVGVETENHAWP
jgi:hypothetical protein